MGKTEEHLIFKTRRIILHSCNMLNIIIVRGWKAFFCYAIFENHFWCLDFWFESSFLCFGVADVGVVMILFDDFFEHFCLVKIGHRFLDGKMFCMKSLICKIDFLQQFVVGLVCGFFVQGVAVKCAVLVGLFTCILSFQHFNIENEFRSLICSVINIFDFEFENLILRIVGIDFCTFMLNVVCRVNFDMLICNIGIIDLIFFSFEGLVGFRTFSWAQK